MIIQVINDEMQTGKRAPPLAERGLDRHLRRDGIPNGPAGMVQGRPVRAGLPALCNTQYGSVCANCPRDLQVTLDKGCKALIMDSGTRGDQEVEHFHA